MGPGAIAGIQAGASLLGGVLGNRAQRKESQRNRNFQERMRNTQWQAAVADMEAAGINPALAYSQGPAASPGGSMASQSDVISPAVSSGLQARRMKADLDLIKSQVSKTEAETERAKNEADMAWARLAAYRVERTPSGKLRFLTDPGDLPLMSQEIRANIARTLATGQREGYTAATLKPMADLAGNLGQILPMLYLLSQGGGLLKGIGSLRQKPPPNITKNIKNFWRR